MEKFMKLSLFEVGNLSYEEIKSFILEIKGDLDDLIKKDPDRIRMLFARLFSVTSSYDEFCEFIIKNIKPTLSFYEYASNEMVFFKRKKAPTFFFNSENDEYDDLKYATADVMAISEKVFSNVYAMIDKINGNLSKKQMEKIKSEFVKNMYASDMPFLETGNKYFLLTHYDWLDKNLEITKKDKIALYNLAMLESGIEFTFPFFIIPDDDDLEDDSEEVYPFRDEKEGLVIVDNYSKFIEDNETLLAKVVESLLEVAIPYKNTLVKRIISNYETKYHKKFELIDIDNYDEKEDYYTKIIDHYMDKFINGTSTDDENELFLMELMNSEYEPEELQKHLSDIEKVIFTNKNPFLLVLYQSLLIQEYTSKLGLKIEEYYYSPTLIEDGAYCEDYDEVRFYLFDEADLEFECTIFEAMITAYHEARHVYQFQKYIYATSTDAFLNCIDRELVDKSFKENNNAVYKERYEDVFYEREARIHAYYETIKRLCKNNKMLLKDFFKSIKNPQNEMDNAIKYFHNFEYESFRDDYQKQSSIETFCFELESLYNTFSLPEIAAMREKYPTFEIAMHEDGTLLTYKELYERYQKETDDIMVKGFIYGLLKKYQELKDVYNDKFNLFADSTYQK